jgi:hypothetical protein
MSSHPDDNLHIYVLKIYPGKGNQLMTYFVSINRYCYDKNKENKYKIQKNIR